VQEEEEAENERAGDAADFEKLSAVEVCNWEQRVLWDEKSVSKRNTAVSLQIGEADAGLWLDDVAWDDSAPAESRARRLVLDETDREIAWEGRVVRREETGTAAAAAALFARTTDPLERLSGDAWYRIQVGVLFG
jgi:hypothetical protein